MNQDNLQEISDKVYSLMAGHLPKGSKVGDAVDVSTAVMIACRFILEQAFPDSPGEAAKYFYCQADLIVKAHLEIKK